MVYMGSLGINGNLDRSHRYTWIESFRTIDLRSQYSLVPYIHNRKVNRSHHMKHRSEIHIQDKVHNSRNHLPLVHTRSEDLSVFVHLFKQFIKNELAQIWPILIEGH